MTSSISALSAYRQILRATRIAFQDDYTLISAARAEARKGFESHRKPSVDTPMKIHHAEEVASLLRHNIVQGVQEDDRWRLRIHDDIERGDNDSVKIEGKNVKVDKPCSS